MECLISYILQSSSNSNIPPVTLGGAGNDFFLYFKDDQNEMQKDEIISKSLSDSRELSALISVVLSKGRNKT